MKLAEQFLTLSYLQNVPFTNKFRHSLLIVKEEKYKPIPCYYTHRPYLAGVQDVQYIVQNLSFSPELDFESPTS